MTLNEFKAWLSGYECSFLHREYPNWQEWQNIKEKLHTICDSK